MTDSIVAHDTFWDALKGAVEICDPEDVEPIDVISTIHQMGAHGVSATQGLIIHTTDGRHYRLRAELLP